MIVEAGHYALVLALALALVQSVLPLWGTWRRDPSLVGTAVPVALGQMGFVMLSFAALTYAHVASDFSVLNVVENSHSAKPLIYKLSGVWGSHSRRLMRCFSSSCVRAMSGSSRWRNTLFTRRHTSRSAR